MHTDWSVSWMESGPMGGGEGGGRLDCNLSGPGTHWQGPLDHLSNILKSSKCVSQEHGAIIKLENKTSLFVLSLDISVELERE